MGCAITLLKPISLCTKEITVGKVSELSSIVNVVIKNMITERTIVLQAETDSDGLVKVNVEEIYFSDRFKYNISVTKQGVDIEDALDLNIDAATEKVYELNFYKAVDEDDDCFKNVNTTLHT